MSNLTIAALHQEILEAESNNKYLYEILVPTQYGYPKTTPIRTKHPFLVIKLNYPDCTNFEGNKILVYENVTYKDLKKQKSLDPHFSQNKKYHSPIARFEPTDRGWSMALQFVVFQTMKDL